MVKYVVKLKNYRIGTQIGVIVEMDPMIMIVVTKRQKDKKAKRQKDKKKKKKKKKELEGPPRLLEELEQGGHRPPKF